MSVYLQDPDFTLHQGDALETLRELPDESVHMCVTSPPFYGLRDYGTGEWEGGKDGCDHEARQKRRNAASQPGTGNAGVVLRDGVPPSECKCGARRVDQQIGLEQTPDVYVARIVDVFREVRRVLRDDGTCWVELGDSYSGTNVNGQRGPNADASMSVGHRMSATPRLTTLPGVKPKDLLGIPWMVAFALRADGWWLRSDIVWARPNPMPESVTDRPTKSHSYVFLLSKSARYFFDQEAVREPSDAVGPSWEERKAAGEVLRHGLDGAAANGSGGYGAAPGGRNVRSVWNIPTQPLPDEHYAAFPEKLVERCILAGSPAGGTVLDCFIGSGTTALVARRHGRRTIGIELSPDYCAIAARRLQQQSLFA